MPRTLLSGLVLAFALTGGALAETTDHPPPAGANPNVRSDRFEPGATNSTQTLSERLDATDGVIRPPATGAGRVITPPVPEPNSTPVITPPGEPGGNPLVQPK
ncbi:MAG: hypothetical protein JO048_09385 [Methylobacteriaceae bacterium]|nr:hypothetical protein [Methylobacteriaceae bacterium]